MPVILQTDWLPQPEHGGFYQALARGFYEEAGLEVTILPGGPNAMSTQKILMGRAHFAMNRADTIYNMAWRDIPVIMVMATLQEDPQALMLHASNPVSQFGELDGKPVKAVPGLTWITWLEAKYGIQMNIIPHDYGMERFLNDPGLIQQCLLTNEPFYIRQAGLDFRLMRLADSGFNPYHGIYCLQSYAVSNPETVRAFVSASVRGWQDFILGDPAPALELIAERNQRMTPEFMDFSYQTLRQERLITGESGQAEAIGRLDDQRMEELMAELQAVGIVEPDPDHPMTWYTTEFLP